MASPMLWTMRVIVVFTTWIMVFTPAPMLYKIFKTKSVGQAPIFPLAAMLASSHMWLLHGYINHNIFPAVMTFIVGDTVGLIYIAIYLRYTTERAYVVKVVGLTLVFLCAMSAFAFTAKNDNVVGPVAGVAALVLYGWPFERMQLVLQHKSNEYIPVVIVSRATLNNVMWIIYTALDGNWYTFAPHVISVIMGIAQLSLYYVHHPSRRVQNQHSATTVIDVEDARGRTVSIAIETPKTDLVASKLIPESPSFQLMHSPLAPLM